MTATYEITRPSNHFDHAREIARGDTPGMVKSVVQALLLRQRGNTPHVVTLDALAHSLSRSKSSVQRSLRWLRDEQLIQIVKRYDDYGRRLANGYRLILEPFKEIAKRGYALARNRIAQRRALQAATNAIFRRNIGMVRMTTNNRQEDIPTLWKDASDPSNPLSDRETAARLLWKAGAAGNGGTLDDVRALCGLS